MESFRQAIAAGAECLELDVHLSADGVAVIIHVPTLDRTTDSTGAIASRRSHARATARSATAQPFHTGRSDGPA